MNETLRSSPAFASKPGDTRPPAKHLPHGNYRRADWFEARCKALEAALREIAVGLLPEDRAAGDDKMYMLCASRLCGIARDAIRSELETTAVKP